MRQVFSRDSSSLSLLILSESTFCVLWMFHLELVQWFEHDLYCLCMLQFHSDGLGFKILVVCELNWDMQTTKRVERFRHCGRPVSAEKLRVLAMKVKKVSISIYQSKVEHILQGLVKSSWCRRQCRIGYSTLTINMLYITGLWNNFLVWPILESIQTKGRITTSVVYWQEHPDNTSVWLWWGEDVRHVINHASNMPHLSS
jgi:hypothetical protein